MSTWVTDLDKNTAKTAFFAGTGTLGGMLLYFLA